MLEHGAIQSAVNNAYEAFSQEEGGENANYIPFLASVDSSLSGLAVVTAKGDIFTAGDTVYRFAIESISKICTLALALEDHGPQTIQQKIGADPTGLPFNSVIALELHGDKPMSPLVNAGAMATTSLVKACSTEERWQRILKMQQRLTSPKVAISDELNQSEQTTNFHNKGIAWLLYSAGFMYSDPMEACDVYTRQCSTLL
ncbi:glutaminase, partial [Providencia rettgeri]